MAKIPQKSTTTTDLIYKHYEDSRDEHREHLGCSLIGHPCSRYLWYTFRWAVPSDFSGRLLRLFGRGNDEEIRFVKELRNIGVTIWEINPETGKQYRFVDVDGHFGGSCDGIGLGFVEAPKTHHVIEFKTSNDKSFKTLCKNGVEKGKPQHYAQMQMYMGYSGLKRAIYFCTNKNDDSIYQERIYFNKDEFNKLRDKAKYIIEQNEPPHKLKSDASFYPCVMCSAKNICHLDKTPVVNCRTCAHSTPVENGKWLCELHNQHRDKQAQIEGCSMHLFNPHLLPGDMIIADRGNQWVHYQYNNVEYFNVVEDFKNETQNFCYTSGDLSVLSPQMIGDKNIEAFKKEMGATIG